MLQKLKQLKQRQGFMRYFKNTTWLFAEKILRMVVGLFVGIWVARYLGPEQFGLISYAQSFVTLFTAIATLGLDGIVIRELVKDESKRDVLLGTAFRLNLIGALIVLIVLAVAVKLSHQDALTTLLVFVIASATIFQSFNVIDFYFQSKVLSKYIVYANVVSLLISSLIKVAFILNEAPLLYFAYVILFDSFILACGFLYVYRVNKLQTSRWEFNANVALSLLKDGWPLMFSGAVLMLQARIDQVMLKEMMGSIEVGYYSAAMRLIEALAFAPMLIKNSLYPLIQEGKTHSIKLYESRLLNFYRLNFILFLVIGIPIFLLSENIVVLLFGGDYQPAGVLLAMLSIRLFFANMGVARSSYLLTENLMKFSFLTMVLGTFTNIGLNYIWIPSFGAEGAIVASIISFFVTIFLVDIMYSKTRKNVLLQLKSLFTFYKLDLG